jgi:hypothetical protein
MYTTLHNFALVRDLPISNESIAGCCNCGCEHTANELFADTLGRIWCTECVGNAKVANIYELGMHELTRLLDRLDIPYEDPVAMLDGQQIRFNWCDGDVICHCGSYGGHSGLLETMGFEMDNADVTGYLTAMQALEIILHEWNNKEKEEQ